MGKCHTHTALLLCLHLLRLLLTHERLLLEMGSLLHDCIIHSSRAHHSRVLLLLLSEHRLGLLRLQVGQCMRIGPHTGLHTHHGSSLTDGSIGT